MMRIKATLLLASAVLVCALPFFAAETSHTLDPWPYGAVTWVGRVPQNAPAIIDVATQSVHDVFGFWGLPAPEPATNWDTWAPMHEEAWNERDHRPLYAGFVPVPATDSTTV